MGKRYSLTKGSSIFIIDILLIPAFILLIISGLKIHVETERLNNMMFFWMRFHLIMGLVVLFLLFLHTKAHWGWYKNLMKKKKKPHTKSRTSKATGIIFILFVLSAATGLVLFFFIKEINSSVGIWHYRISLLMAILVFAHVIKRLPRLTKGLKNIDRKNAA